MEVLHRGVRLHGARMCKHRNFTALASFRLGLCSSLFAITVLASPLLDNTGNCIVMFTWVVLIQQVIDGKILCVHGGLSPHLSTLDQMRLIERNQEIPQDGPFCGNVP